MTTISSVWNTAKQQCLDLDMKPSVGNAKKLIKRGGRSMKDAKNYVARQAFINIADKPYTNEFGEQDNGDSVGRIANAFHFFYSIINEIFALKPLVKKLI